MAVCSCDIETVVHDRCFFMDFDFVCGDAGQNKVWKVHGQMAKYFAKY